MQRDICCCRVVACQIACRHKMRRGGRQNRPASGRETMLDFVQQLVSGIALGCVYGLIALGFVLIYKATEGVNFAQGDLMMLGGFFAFTFIAMLGFNYWLGFAGAVIAMALFGMLAERVVVRPILGYPQFSIIMVTIGLGFFLRSMAGIIWGTDDLKIDTPFSAGVLKIGPLVLAYDKLSVIAATVILCTLLYLFFNKTTLGSAMRASSENMLAAYYMGIPVRRAVSIVWAISAAVAASEVTIEPSFWWPGLGAYAATALRPVVTLLFLPAGTATIIDQAGVIWNVKALYGVCALASIFTMGAFSMLALLRLTERVR